MRWFRRHSKQGRPEFRLSTTQRNQLLDEEHRLRADAEQRRNEERVLAGSLHDLSANFRHGASPYDAETEAVEYRIWLAGFERGRASANEEVRLERDLRERLKEATRRAEEADRAIELSKQERADLRQLQLFQQPQARAQALLMGSKKNA